MKRRFRWWLSAILLYLLSVAIIFILIGLPTLLVTVALSVYVGGQGSSVFLYYWIFFMLYIGAPLSLLSSFFVPPFVLRWIRKRRLRRLSRLQR